MAASFQKCHDAHTHSELFHCDWVHAPALANLFTFDLKLQRKTMGGNYCAQNTGFLDAAVWHSHAEPEESHPEDWMHVNYSHILLDLSE